MDQGESEKGLNYNGFADFLSPKTSVRTTTSTTNTTKKQRLILILLRASLGEAEDEQNSCYAKFRHCIEEAVVDIGVIMLIIAMAADHQLCTGLRAGTYGAVVFPDHAARR